MGGGGNLPAEETCAQKAKRGVTPTTESQRGEGLKQMKSVQG